MANDTYTADANGKVFAGRFDITPLTSFIESAPFGWSQYTGSNINELLPASEPEFADIAILETDTTRKLSNWANKWGYDRQRRKIVGIGTSEGYFSSVNTRGKHVTFDLKTDTFTPKYAPLSPIQQEGHVYDRNSSIPDKFGRFWASAESSTTVRLWYRDPVTELYVFEANVPAYETTQNIFAVEVFPELGLDGAVVMFGGRGTLAIYDLNTKTWSQHAQYENDNRYNYGVCIYVAGKIVFGGGEPVGGGAGSNQLRVLESNGSITALSTAIPNKINCKSDYKYIPSPIDGDFAAYYLENDTNKMYKHNIANDTWLEIGTIPPLAGGLVTTIQRTLYVSLRGLNTIVCLFGRGRSAGGLDQSEFWIYKVA